MKLRILTITTILYLIVIPFGYAQSVHATPHTSAGQVQRQEGEIFDPIADATDRLFSQLKDFFAVKEARVLKVAAGNVYLNLGDEDSIVPDMEFEVVRQGEEITDPSTNEVLGKIETQVGEIKIKSVRQKMSIATVIKEEENMQTNENDVAFSKVTRKKIAVAELTERGDYKTALGLLFSDMLITRLSQERKFQVIARSRLEKSLLELGLNTTDILASDSAQKVGQAIDADAILIGAVLKLNGVFDVTIRLVDTKTATIITSAHTTLKEPENIRVSRQDIARVPPSSQKDTSRIQKPKGTPGKTDKTNIPTPPTIQSEDGTFFQEDLSEYADGDSVEGWGEKVMVLINEDGRHYLLSKETGERTIKRDVNFPQNFEFGFATIKIELIGSYTLKLIDSQGQELKVKVSELGMFRLGVTLADGPEESPRSYTISGGSNPFKLVKEGNIYKVYIDNEFVTSGHHEEFANFVRFEISANFDHLGFTNFLGKIPEK